MHGTSAYLFSKLSLVKSHDKCFTNCTIHMVYLLKTVLKRKRKKENEIRMETNFLRNFSCYKAIMSQMKAKQNSFN